MSFERYISPQIFWNLEEFCTHINKLSARPLHGPLAPEYVLEHYNFHKKSIAGWLGSYGASYSGLFLHELATQQLDNSCGLRPAVFCRWLYGRIRPYNVFKIYDEIRTLEWINLSKKLPLEQRPESFRLESPQIRKSLTKPAQQFKGRILGGFWHKHHMQAEFIPTNMYLQNKRPKTILRLEQSEKDTFSAYAAGRDSWGTFINSMIHAFSMVSYIERVAESSLTGEWLVYAHHEEKNHYLTLATHKERDEEILQRIGRCRDDFPFLDEYPQFK